jgi:hypothetical protein
MPRRRRQPEPPVFEQKYYVAVRIKGGWEYSSSIFDTEAEAEVIRQNIVLAKEHWVQVGKSFVLRSEMVAISVQKTVSRHRPNLGWS